jgi:membrane-bound lytic murein transglycosylase D
MTDSPFAAPAWRALLAAAVVALSACASAPPAASPDSVAEASAAGSVAAGTAAAPSAAPAPAAPVTAPAAPPIAPPATASATASAAASAAPSAAPSVAPSTEPSTASPTPTAPASTAPEATDSPLAVRARLDPADDATRGDLWQRIRDGLAMPDLDNELVRKWEQWYATRPDYVARMTERGSRYLFHIVEEVTRRGLPTELALLPFIESAFNPQALSHARASGMWQFMPATGKDFELRQNLFRDDRRDVLASTRAALDYLERLHGRFDDWHLALAAYNWGQGNVQRAVNRNVFARRPADYESLLRLPQETREYVPKLQAVKNIVRRPEAFGLTLPPLQDRPFFTVVTIERDIDVELASRLAGLEPDDFHSLNPQHNKPVILAAGTPQVLLPYDNANRFVQALAAHRGPLASWTAWVAPRTLKAAEAARLVGMDEDELRTVNRIPPRMMVRAGSTLLVARAPHAHHANHDVPESIAEFASLRLAPEGRALRRVSFRAGPKGESVAAVARRYRVSAQQLAQWNDVQPGGRFRAGETIVVMQPVRAAARPAATPPRAQARGPSQARAREVVRAKAQGRSARPARAQVAQSRAAGAREAAPVRRNQRPR